MFRQEDVKDLVWVAITTVSLFGILEVIRDLRYKENLNATNSYAFMESKEFSVLCNQNSRHDVSIYRRNV